LQSFLADRFWSIFAIVSVVPAQPVGTALQAEVAPPAPCAISPRLLDQLWQTSEAEACGLLRLEFDQILLRVGMAQNFGLPSGLASQATEEQQTAFFQNLRLSDLVLARACASGHERAWERFIALYRQPLLRAGMAITGNESLGRELADGLYAELYGLTVRDGERRCPLDSYAGRGSLLGWLRTTLAQRFVDQHRRTHREQPLDETSECPAPPVATPASDPALPLLSAVVEEALERQGPEERFLLASYYLDGRRLHEIAALFGVHEATVSRRLKRVTGAVRKQILRGLERRGLSRRAAEEALATDPRDLSAPQDSMGASDVHPSLLRLKELLQKSPIKTFSKQAER
jgi:RNA polymerase sigma-70 factor (ECF subfamily)